MEAWLFNEGLEKIQDREMKTIVICGPTSTGKTALAVKLCRKFNGEIISADSRQVVKYMDVGTGKIPALSVIKSNPILLKDGAYELDGVRIWGYDLVDPVTRFSSFDFAKFVQKKADEISALGKMVFLVGGTGFYIDMFTGDSVPAYVEPDYEYRAFLETQPLGFLQSELKKANPGKFSKIDTKNRARLIRALEIEKAVPSLEKPRNTKSPDCLFIGLTSSRDVLYGRADKWLDDIWRNGIFDEVSRLKELGYGDSWRLKGLIYKHVVDAMIGAVTSEEARTRAKFDLHAYIRRQQTWFKKNPEINWLDIAEPGSEEKAGNLVKSSI